MNKALWILIFTLLTGCSVAQSPGYLDVLPIFWRNIYPDGGETLYCGVNFKPFDRRVNVEHVFPMSWVTKELRCGKRQQCRRSNARFNQIEADMHNLYPALKDVNELRSAYAYAEIPGEVSAYKNCDIELHKWRIEPRPAVRGNIARAMLYMADQHGLKLHDRQRRLMQQWHWADLPDKQEKKRNTKIGRLQGNRNPFIDEPERVPKKR